MDSEKSTYEKMMENLEELRAYHKNYEVNHYKRQLKDCVNELCSRCGRYRNEHLGACDGCKWKKVRCGDDE